MLRTRLLLADDLPFGSKVLSLLSVLLRPVAIRFSEHELFFQILCNPSFRMPYAFLNKFPSSGAISSCRKSISIDVLCPLVLKSSNYLEDQKICTRISNECNTKRSKNLSWTLL